MVYECEECQTVLPPGVPVCPGCGATFDEPVPEDAEVKAQDEGVEAQEAFPYGVSTSQSGSSRRITFYEPDAASIASNALPTEYAAARPVPRQSLFRPVLASVFAFFVLTAAILLVIHVLESGKPTRPAVQPQPAGTHEGMLIGAPLKMGGRADIVLLAHDLADIQSFTKANVLRNESGMGALVHSGHVYILPSGQFRAKLMASIAPGFIQVRILSGSHQGTTAWTYKECLQP